MQVSRSGPTGNEPVHVIVKGDAALARTPVRIAFKPRNVVGTPHAGGERRVLDHVRAGFAGHFVTNAGYALRGPADDVADRRRHTARNVVVPVTQPRRLG